MIETATREYSGTTNGTGDWKNAMRHSLSGFPATSVVALGTETVVDVVVTLPRVPETCCLPAMRAGVGGEAKAVGLREGKRDRPSASRSCSRWLSSYVVVGVRCW